jgi:hypothetical protein
MSWPRWFAAVVLATLGALIVSIGAGDFDARQHAARQQVVIEQARSASGVDLSGSRP